MKTMLFCTETPKVAFAASLGGNGVVKTIIGNKDLIYRDVLTNVGGAYNAETGEIQSRQKMRMNASMFAFEGSWCHQQRRRQTTIRKLR